MYCYLEKFIHVDTCRYQYLIETLSFRIGYDVFQVKHINFLGILIFFQLNGFYLEHLNCIFYDPTETLI